MPTYIYQCNSCQDSFEVLATFKEKEAGLNPNCPKCASTETRQLITAGLIIKNSANSLFNQPGCPPDAGPGCCG